MQLPGDEPGGNEDQHNRYLANSAQVIAQGQECGAGLGLAADHHGHRHLVGQHDREAHRRHNHHAGGCRNTAHEGDQRHPGIVQRPGEPLHVGVGTYRCALVGGGQVAAGEVHRHHQHNDEQQV